MDDMKTDTMINRRKMLGMLGAGAGAVVLAACGGDKSNNASEATTTTTADSDGSTSTTAATTATTAGTTATTTAPAASGSPVGEIPSETGGPYPGDGTNGPNVLTDSAVVRSDIRSSFGSKSGTADGVPLEIVLTITDADTGAALPGKAVYLWHCDGQGRYSLYSQGATNANYLRGVQVADANGVLRFKSIFPAAYDGRWPHIHFEIFDSASQAATTGRSARNVTQLALPESICRTVYESAGYESSKSNLSHTSLTSDMVFRDGVDKQLATVTGSVANGYVASLRLGV